MMDVFGITYEDLEHILAGKTVRVCKTLFVKLGEEDLLSTNGDITSIILTQASLDTLIIHERVHLSDFIVEMSV